ncbi:hypothetical protein BT67DRAFT_303722 [Trichocladium antarcticum]|uniref:Uncharacterized protein n=1 Tax=Trichocladium antarcticum TaxID=1450529 RepID=A0AAN6ULD5_9PEZI|nr:hypothetical protein BT67DRAFT_303722 [Trichocladium antarcticum]
MALPDLTVLAQWLGIVGPALYAGITFQYSQTLSLLSTTSPAPLLALQWLRLYQQGPRWVPPLLGAGTLANIYLALGAAAAAASTHHPNPNPNPTPRAAAVILYPLAAALTACIVPLTFLYFEPGINGACKWKAQGLLSSTCPGGAEAAGTGTGTGLAEGSARSSRVNWSVEQHSAGKGAKAWAAREEMAALVRGWAGRNYGRVAVAVVAAGVSGLATLGD